jgi:hypothetical protein
MQWLRIASDAVYVASLRSADNLQRTGEICFIRDDVGLWRCLGGASLSRLRRGDGVASSCLSRPCVVEAGLRYDTRAQTAIAQVP